jgi:hypothetical protein
MTDEAEQVGVAGMEWMYLILADGAQVQNGKLYVLGGGWDRLQFPEYPKTLPVAIALGIRVPWGETNRQHTLEIRGLTADNDQELFRVDGQFETGRPPGTPAGMPMSFQATMQLPLHVPGPGQYYLRATIDGRHEHRVPYFAVQIPGVPG